MPFDDFPRTPAEFERRFGDEVSCWEYLRALKWPNGFRCAAAACAGERSYFVIERGVDECATCGRQTSVTAGTMFHRTRTPLRAWFRAIFEFVSRKHGCNAMDIQRLVGVSYPTAWTWLQKIRDVMVRERRSQLADDVEVDETYVGAPEPGVYGRDLGANKVLVVGAVEIDADGCGRARLRPVASAAAEDVQAFVCDVVEEGATVRTDGLPAYNGLSVVYDHRVKIIGDPKTASDKFPRIHRVFALFKRVLLGTYQGSWSKKWAAMYCEEFVFRFNRRRSRARTTLVRRVLEEAVRRPPRVHRFVGNAFDGQVVPVAA
jgi:hypothetical protein